MYADKIDIQTNNANSFHFGSVWIFFHALHAGIFENFMLLLLSADFFSISVSNGLVPDQGRRFVGPDLGPDCLQRLSADDKSDH